jgi:ribosomal protein L7Ae-like RNA K-turn-binding protein
MVFLAEDCDNDEYKNTVTALARLQGVPLVEIPTWVELKDFCNLGLASKVIAKIAEEKGKEPKIKPRCSVACIIVKKIKKIFIKFFFFIKFIYFRIGEKIQKLDILFTRN